MSYTVSGSALWVTCVCTLQTSEPRIRPGTHRTDEPERSGDRDHHQRGRGYKGDNAHINNSPIPLLWGRKPKSKLFSCVIFSVGTCHCTVWLWLSTYTYILLIFVFGADREPVQKRLHLCTGGKQSFTHTHLHLLHRGMSQLWGRKKNTLTLSNCRWSRSFLKPSQNSIRSQYTGYCSWKSHRQQTPSVMVELFHSFVTFFLFFFSCCQCFLKTFFNETFYKQNKYSDEWRK